MCPRLKKPCTAPGGGLKIQAGKPADGDGKAEFHIVEPSIFQIRRVSTTGSVSIKPTGAHRPISRDMGPSDSPNVTNAMVSGHVAHTVEPHEQSNVTHTSVSALGI